MNAKQYLNQYRLLDRRIESKSEQLMRMRARLQSLTASYSDMPRGGKATNWTDLSDKCMELEEQLNHEISELAKTRHEIMVSIEGLESPLQRTILEMRYMSGYTWKAIVNKLPYEEAQIYRVHRAGLENVVVPEHLQ